MARKAGGSMSGYGQERVTEIGPAVPKAPEGMRYVGFCRDCRDFVELGPTFSCMKGGHAKDRLAVAVLLDKEEPLPHLPAMNWGALFMPALWGPAHGQWFMLLFYPMWLMMDNLIYGAVHGTFSPTIAVIAIVVAAAFTIFYARSANAYGYVRVAGEKTPEEFMAAERRWAVLFVAIGVAFLVFASWYNLAIRPGLAG